MDTASSFGVFGLFDDSLPDGWGLLLMDRFFQQRGSALAEVSVLDRLAYLGTHPYAFLLNLLSPPLFLDDRALRSWAHGILTPYLFLLEIAMGVLLIASGVRGSWQLLRRFVR